MMNLNNSEREKIILLVERAISKIKVDSPELKEELLGIIDKMSVEETDNYTLPFNISEEDMTYAKEVIIRMEDIVERYVKKIDVNDIVALEEVKKELTAQLMYLSSYKDKFLYEIEYMEEVFKKEIFSKITHEISFKTGISYTQAEKKVNADERYNNLRQQVIQAKIFMSTIKTKYDFFSKMIQVIVQSISVAGKEHYANRVSN